MFFFEFGKLSEHLQKLCAGVTNSTEKTFARTNKNTLKRTLHYREANRESPSEIPNASHIAFPGFLESRVVDRAKLAVDKKALPRKRLVQEVLFLMREMVTESRRACS